MTISDVDLVKGYKANFEAAKAEKKAWDTMGKLLGLPGNKVQTRITNLRTALKDKGMSEDKLQEVLPVFRQRVTDKQDAIDLLFALAENVEPEASEAEPEASEAEPEASEAEPEASEGV